LCGLHAAFAKLIPVGQRDPQADAAFCVPVRESPTPASHIAHWRGANESHLSPVIGQEREMLDIAYVTGTIVFFALMLAYVRGCAALGKESEQERET
jgi:hypothetical protein